MPGFFIDGFTNGSQYIQAAEVMPAYRPETKTHQAADGSGSCVKNVDFVFINDVPETAGVGPGRDAFEHKRSGAGSQWAVNNIRMSRDPPNVRRAEMNITGLILKYVNER